VCSAEVPSGAPAQEGGSEGPSYQHVRAEQGSVRGGGRARSAGACAGTAPGSVSMDVPGAGSISKSKSRSAGFWFFFTRAFTRLRV